MSRLYIAYRPVTPNPPDPTASYEPEVQEYMNQLGIGYDNTIYFGSTIYEITGIEAWDAFNSFAISLKNSFSLTLGVNNLNTIFDAMWTFFGETSTEHKYNFVNPDDTNAAFRLTFSGGWTFSGAGAQPNGTNGYANTWWDTLANCGVRQISLGGYTRTAGASGTMIHGTWDLTNATRVWHFAHNPLFTLGNLSSTGSGSNTRFHAVTLNSVEFRYIANNSSVYWASPADLSLINKPFYLGARNNNNSSVNLYTDKQLAFYYMTGKVELSQADLLNLNAAVDQLMLDLGRNV